MFAHVRMATVLLRGVLCCDVDSLRTGETVECVKTKLTLPFLETLRSVA